MSTVMPHSELLRRAVEWINDTRRDNPEKPLEQLIDEAGMRFNLSPVDCDGLRRLFAETDTQKS